MLGLVVLKGAWEDSRRTKSGGKFSRGKIWSWKQKKLCTWKLMEIFKVPLDTKLATI